MGKRKSRNRTMVHAMTPPSTMATNTAMAEPVLPYAGTSGFSGTDTSEARAVERDTTGKTLSSQNDTLKYLHDAGDNGMTVSELRAKTGWHHGIASSSLTNLHGADKIARLEEKRNRCHVYVHPDFVNGRATQPKGRNKKVAVSCPNCGHSIT